MKKIWLAKGKSYLQFSRVIVKDFISTYNVLMEIVYYN